jgi:hypothetical protein
MTNPKKSGARTEVGPHNTIGVAMEDLPKAERRALEKELEEEMVEARRRKLACFKKTRTGVIKKTIPAIRIVVIPAGVTVMLGLRNPLCSSTSTVGPFLPGFTIAPCVNSLLCYRLIRRPKSIL